MKFFSGRLLSIIWKEFIHIKRDPASLGMMVGIPIFQLLLFGYAINTDVKHLNTVVFDLSKTAESRSVMEAFQNSQYFNLKYQAHSYDEVTKLIDSGKAKVGLILAPDFANLIRGGKTASVQVLIDASDPMVSSSALSTANAIGQVKSLEIIQKNLKNYPNTPNFKAPLDIRMRAWYNPDMLSSTFIVPGLIGVILTMTLTMFTALGIVRERERGTLEQLIASPIKRYELLIGKITPYIFVGYIQMSLALMGGYLLFDVPIAGSLPLLYLSTLLFMFTTLGLGLLISTVARTQQQAMQMSTFIFLPNIFLSGYIFPREGMPELAYILGYIFPLTYFLKILRGIMLKGIGFQHLWKETLLLSILAMVILSIAINRFQKRLN